MRKGLIRRRRRVKDDEGEEEGSVAAGAEDDSLSEASAMSDADEDADAEASDGSDAGSPATKDSENGVVANGLHPQVSASAEQPSSSSVKPLSASNRDTETMMNGLKISDEIEGEAVNFDDLGGDSVVKDWEPTVVQDPQADTSAGERARREHEEYKKKRDADPAFVPNRGMFFMHDHRSYAPGQNGFRPFGRGRGRGRANSLFPAFG